MTAGTDGDVVGEVRGVRLVSLGRVDADNGSLTVAQFEQQIPFVVRRFFTVFDVPTGELRGTHAHRECHQFLVAVRGAVTARVDDGDHVAEVRLDRPERGLYMPPMTWGGQFDYTPDAVLLVLASHDYTRSDYLEDYEQFRRETTGSI